MNLHNTNSFMGKYSLLKKGMLICITLLLAPFANWAQTDPLPTRYKQVDVSLYSDGAKSKSTTEIVTRTIAEPGATWLRLFFKDVNLGTNSTLIITSELDGATQTLNASTIKEWQNTSAYFNGDKVTLRLEIAQGEKSISLDINELGIGIDDPITESQCGPNDDRVDSADNAIGRIVPVGCTGWIIANGKLVTAGHCVGSRAQVIEFNVPKSNPNRTINHPGPEDQYPIGNFVTEFVSGRPETDWAVFEASANTQTGLRPIQAQGKSFIVTRAAPGSRIRVTGFGTDTGIDNQTQQTNIGPLSSVTTTFVRYTTDTTGGNSGSPIIDAATGNAVGVHAYGGCSPSGGSNFGERATIPAFWAAMGLQNEWVEIGGLARDITVDNGGKAWIVNSAGNLYVRGNNKWDIVRGSVRDAGASTRLSITDRRSGDKIFIKNTNNNNNNNNNFTELGGRAIKVDVDKDGRTWVINRSNNIYRRDGNRWTQLSGEALDIGCSANGDIYIVGTNRRIYKYNGSNGWNILSRGTNGSRIDVDRSGRPWLVNTNNDLYRYNTNTKTWRLVRRSVRDVGCSSNGDVWITATNDRIFKWNSQAREETIESITAETETITESITAEINTTTIYPNPAKHKIYISGGKEFTKISIYNIMGRLIVVEPFNGIDFDVSSIKNGMYIVKLTGNTSVKTQNLLIAN